MLPIALYLLLILQLATPGSSQARSCLYQDSSYTRLTNLQHEIQQQQSCVLCRPECTTCLAADDWTCSGGNCQSRYYFDARQERCLRCEKLCQECPDATSCAKCIDGYFLLSTGKCSACPQGVLECTSSSILQCLMGYYYDTQAYICRKCSDPHCVACSVKGKCDTCQASYLLSNDATACLPCGVANCQTCINAGTCTKCLTGYSLQSSFSCLKQNCTSIKNCAQCKNTTNVITCSLCEPGFFLLDNNCHYGASLMCQYSLTWQYISTNQWQLGSGTGLFNRLLDYGSCATCNTSIAKQADNTETYCTPKMIGAREGFFVDFISYEEFVMCSMPYLMISKPLDSFVYSYQMMAAYRATITLVLVVSNVSINTNSLTSPASLLNLQLNLQNTLSSLQMEPYPLFCSTPPLSNSALIAKLTLGYKILTDYLPNSTTLEPLSLTISLNKSLTNLSTSSLSIKQSYMQLSLCLTENCLQCMSASSCTKCIYPYFIQNFLCVLKCDIGYYVNQATRTCRSQCEIGYFFDAGQTGTESLCIPCPSSCVKCTGMNNCGQCKTGFFLTVQGLCSVDCLPIGSELSEYYPNLQDNLCKKCENPCRTCSYEAKNCTSCLIGFQFANNTYGVCVFECPSGYFSKVLLNSTGPFQANPKCLPCSTNCTTCEIQSVYCTSCTNGYYLYERKCLALCPSGYFGTAERVVYENAPYCKSCSTPCGQCWGVQSNCTSCLFQLYLLVINGTGRCYSECPVQIYYANSTSRACNRCSDQNCLRCALIPNSIAVNETNYSQLCSQCSNGFLLQKSQCVSTCSNAWPINSVCQNCPYPCSICSGISSTNYTCSQCSDGYYVDPVTGRCTLVCPLGTYGNQSTHVCTKCPASCSQCRLSFNSSVVQCLSCQQDYLVFNYACIPQTQGCPSTTYQPSSLSKCLSCSSSCLECSATETHCTKCQNGKYLVAEWGQCVAPCPHGYYTDQGVNICRTCWLTCSDCYGTADNCTLCPVGSYKFFNSTTLTSACISQQQCSIMSGFFANRHDGLCQKCQSPCSDCMGEFICLSCDNSTYLYGNSCVPQCPSNQYGSNRLCMACPQACLTCASVTVCSTCKPNYFYRSNSSQCLHQCPALQFGNKGSMTCEPCRYPCQTCLNHEYCVTCNATILNGLQIELILLNGKCVASCPDGYYNYVANGSQQCIKCNQSCETCTSKDVCLACNLGFVLSGNNCLNSSMCPVGFYSDSSIRACSKCQPPCLTCKSKYQCTTCITSHSLKDDSCYINCPIGTFVQDGLCLKCPGSCSRCSGLSQCLSCTNGTYLFTNSANNVSQCVSTCPLGTYFDIVQSSCLGCMKSCATCVDRNSKCTSCPLSKVLQNEMCLDKCSNFYYQQSVTIFNSSSRSCARCNDSCLQCTSFDSCQICQSTYLIQLPRNKSYCSLQCPSAMFKNSQKFICQNCEQGCLRCQNQLNCLQCSLEQGYVLYNTKCLPSPCSQSLYTIVEENRCVDKSVCQQKPDLYFIHEKERKCYRKDGQGCPKHLVLKNTVECTESCPDGFVVNYSRFCVESNNKGEKFELHSVNKNGKIQLMIEFGAKMNKEWASMFNNVTIREGIAWNLSATSQQQQRRLLASANLVFQISQPYQTLQNALILHLIPQAQVASPTDLTIIVTLNSPYSNQISVEGLPLQNWQAQTTISAYIVTTQQLQNLGSRLPPNALSIILIIIAIIVSLLNFIKSSKIYLLLPTWDTMHLLYLMGYMNVYWPLHTRTFFHTFFVTWIKWFNLNTNHLIVSPQKVYLNAGDQNWISNLLSNFVFMGVMALAYGIYVLVCKFVHKRSKKVKKIIHNTHVAEVKKQNQATIPITESPIPLKLLLSVCYLCSTNIFYFSLLNIFYNPTSLTNYFIYPSAIAVMIGLGLLAYLFYRQLREKTLLDSGINPLKKSIIISLPLYLVFRKVFVVLFLAIFPGEPAFSLCFGLITTAFIFILICWFEPYHSLVRYRITLAHELTLSIFFLFSFIYVCNERYMMQTGYTGFLVFLAVLLCATGLAYPIYHLSVLVDLRGQLMRIMGRMEEVDGKTRGYCTEQKTDQIDSQFQIGEQAKQLEDQGYKPPQDQNEQQKETEELSCAKCIPSLQEKTIVNPTQQQGQKKKKKRIKLPKDKLIPNQTDHEADESSQQGQKRKMKLANYTVRLTKKAAPVVNQFKNYDLDNGEGQNDEEGLAEKQIQLSKLIEKQKTLLKMREKGTENPFEMC